MKTTRCSKLWFQMACGVALCAACGEGAPALPPDPEGGAEVVPTQEVVGGGTAVPGSRHVCGDGVIESVEECEDGNESRGDGCSGCRTEQDWSCEYDAAQQRSVCMNRLGDRQCGAAACRFGSTCLENQVTCGCATLPETECDMPAVLALGLLPGTTDCQPRAVSADSSTVVGYCIYWHVRGPTSYATVWRRGQPVAEVFNASTETSANGVSADGSIVVGADYAAGFRMQGADVEYVTAVPVDVSADGTVMVGVSRSVDPVTGGIRPDRAFRRVQGSELELLPCPDPERSCVATKVSGDGSVVLGVSDQYGSAERVGTWTRDGSLQELPGSEAADVLAHAINVDGSVIVGAIGSGNEPAVPARWTPGGLELLSSAPGAAVGVSADGRRILYYSESQSYERQYFLLDGATSTPLEALLPEGALQALPVEDATLVFLTQLSGDGKSIVGSMRSSDAGSTLTRAVLLQLP